LSHPWVQNLEGGAGSDSAPLQPPAPAQHQRCCPGVQHSALVLAQLPVVTPLGPKLRRRGRGLTAHPCNRLLQPSTSAAALLLCTARLRSQGAGVWQPCEPGRPAPTLLCTCTPAVRTCAVRLCYGLQPLGHWQNNCCCGPQIVLMHTALCCHGCLAQHPITFSVV
jgi:hypothetical protein